MKIEIVDGPDRKGDVCTFDGSEPVTIGRGEGCRLTIRDPEASRSHAEICVVDGRAVLRDLDSKNGTRLNGNPVSEAPLADGDHVSIGMTDLRVAGLPSGSPFNSADLRFRGGEGQSVLVTLNHIDADMLHGRTAGSASVDEMRRENDVLREICRISQLLAGKQAPDRIVADVLEQMHGVLRADTACVLLRAADGNEWTIRGAVGDVERDGALNVSQTIINQALADGTAIVIGNPAEDDRFDASQSIVAQHVSSAMCSPLQIGERRDGVLFVDRRGRSDAFDALDLRLTATVANLLGVLLEKERYEAEMKRQQRLAVIGEVIAGLAHYIKNVVTGFSLSVSNLETAIEKRKYDFLGPCVKTIAGMERRISDLMLNMLTYAKDRKPEPRPVEVRPMLEDLVEPYRDQLAQQAIELDCVVDDDTPAVLAEERDLFRVILNLFLNAVDAVGDKPGNKRIGIKVGKAPEEDGVVFCVRDTGKGIPRDKLDQIFTAFFSTKGSRGTGLGLAVVAKIIDEHGGRMEVDSEEGEWTEFRFALPAAEGTGAG